MISLEHRIKRVAIYLRKSRNNEGEETEETLAKHRTRLLDIAHKNNWKYEMFQEVGSSMDETRPQYQLMKTKLTKGIFDAVLSVNLARVTRDDAETPVFMKLLRQEEILFVTDNERIYDLDIQEDWQTLKFTGFVNNWEYENIKAQLRKGKKDSARMGRWSNGVPNYGYVYNRLEKTLEIDPKKAEGVKLAFQMVIEGVGVDIVAINLNKLGFRTNRGNPFRGHSITRMIRSEIYKGMIVSNRLKGRNTYEGKLRPKEQWIISEDAVEPIIDKKTWELANAELDKRKGLSPRAKQRRHGLSSLIKCGICGKSHSIGERNRRQRLVIQHCLKPNHLGVRCYNRGLNYNAMMELIINSIKDRKAYIIKEIESLKVLHPKTDSKATKIKALHDQITKNKKALEILQLQLEEELIDIKSFKDRKTKREIALNDLQLELHELENSSTDDLIESKITAAERLDHFLKNWQQFDPPELNEALHSFIEKITWLYPRDSDDPPKMTINWVD
ncbi:recombinase family protein [Bacillus velezensis]